MQPWHYDPPPDLDQPLLERLRRFPREPDMLVFGARWLAAAVLRGWLKLYHRFTITGRENLPTGCSFVMVANHASHLDTLCMLSALPMGKLHRAYPAAARDYFFVSTPRVLMAAVVTNALPFDRRLDPRHGLRWTRWCVRPVSRRSRRRSTHGGSSRCPWLAASSADLASHDRLGTVVGHVLGRLQLDELVNLLARGCADLARFVGTGHPVCAALDHSVHVDRPVLRRCAICLRQPA
jgi:hypothetical protein